ncbi:MAG: DUF4390 domain-containing protein [Casimicrobiaceae bacterium]
MIADGMPFQYPARALHEDAPSRLRRLARVLVIAAMGFAFTSPVVADNIPVNEADLRVEEGEVLLSAEFDLALNPTLEEALQNGVPLYFVLEFELTRNRWYWFDAVVAGTSITHRVSYNALTRQYRVASGLLALTFPSLPEVERYIGRVTSRPVARADALVKGIRYAAFVRLRLDVNLLPKPFQLDALASREWTLSSEWYRWSFTP